MLAICDPDDDGHAYAVIGASRRPPVLPARFGLIAKEHGNVLQPDAANLGQRGITHDTLQINAADCSADRTGQGLNVQRLNVQRLNVQRLGRIRHAAIFAEIPGISKAPGSAPAASASGQRVILTRMAPGAILVARHRDRCYASIIPAATVWLLASSITMKLPVARLVR